MNYVTEAKRLGITHPYAAFREDIDAIQSPADFGYSDQREDRLCVTNCGSCRKLRNDVREALRQEDADKRLYDAIFSDFDPFEDEYDDDYEDVYEPGCDCSLCFGGPEESDDFDPFGFEDIEEKPSFVYDFIGRQQRADEARARFETYGVDADSLKAQVITDARGLFANLASDMAYNLPPGREASLALTKLEEAAHWAVRAIAGA